MRLRVLIVAGVIFLTLCMIPTGGSTSTGGLEGKLREASTVMWISAHPDDELYVGGTFGHYTRDLGGHLVIVSLYYNPGFVDNNEASAEFLGNAEYIRIEEQLNRQLPRCKNWGQLEDVIKQLEEAGVKEYVKNLILQYTPDIIFSFESSNGYRHSCQHVSMAKIVDDVVKELRRLNRCYSSFDYYYILNRDPNWFGNEYLDPLPVTDVITLDDEMWNYKLTLFDIYSEFYPKLKNETWVNGLEHKEYFRRVIVKQNSVDGALFPSQTYKKNGELIHAHLLKNKGISSAPREVYWQNVEPEEWRHRGNSCRYQGENLVFSFLQDINTRYNMKSLYHINYLINIIKIIGG